MEPAPGLPAWRAIEFARLLALVEGERRFYQQLFSQLPFAAAVYNASGQLELANRAFLTRFSISAPDLHSSTLSGVCGPAAAKAQEVLDSGTPVFEPALTLATSSGPRPFDVGILRLRSPQGDSWHLLVSFQDAVKAAPASPAAAPAPPAAAPAAPRPPEAIPSAPSRRMSDHLDAVFWEMDPLTLRFRSVSARAAEVTGIRREEWRTPAEISQNYVHHLDREAYLEFFGERLREEDAPALEYRVFPPHGPARWLRDEVRAAYSPEGHLEAYAGLTFDITARKHAERDRIESGKLESVERLSARVSHVANNLLMIIGGYAEELRNGLPPDDPRRDDLEAILNAGARLGGLTRQLGQLTKPPQVEAGDFDLLEWMPTAVHRIRSVLHPGMKVDAVLPERSLAVRGDRNLFAQLLEDAARLALHALPPDARLVLAAAPPAAGRPVELSLYFGAAGFPPELHERFFEPFAGPKEPGIDPPLGLAAHVRALAAAGASARLEGEPGEDPRLVLRIAPGAAAGSPAAGGAHYTVLLVDDEPVIRSLVRRALQAEGYYVLEAPSTSAALRIAEEHPTALDLLVTDVDLPEAGGLALAEGFRVLRPSTPVLFITGNPAGLPPDAAVLKKPFPVPALVEKVSQILHGHAGAAGAGSY